MKKILFIILFGILFAGGVFAHQPNLVEDTPVITDPEISRAFYDELRGEPQKYIIKSDSPFLLYLNLLVPKNTNPDGRYSLKVFKDGEVFAELKAEAGEWTEFYEEFGRDYYLEGPEYENNVSAGEYEIEVYSDSNQGKYVLAVGKIEAFGLKETASAIWLVPQLKAGFFGSSPWGFLLSPLAFIPLIIILIVAVLIIVIIKKFKK